MTVDRLKIINNALMKIGLPLAATLDDCDWNASVVFDEVVEKLLRAHPWGFAQRFVTLARGTTDPTHGYKYAYPLPGDYIKVIDLRCADDLRAPRGRYTISGKMAYTNLTPCNIRYVARVLEPEEWPADFADAVADAIAVEIAALSAEKMSLVPQLLQVAKLSLSEAQLADARENTDRVPLADSLYAARSGQGQ